MSLGTPNRSQSKSSLLPDSLKIRVKQCCELNDGSSSVGKLSILQVTNVEPTKASDKEPTTSSTDEEKTQVDDHEHPCVCDLKLPRKPLTSAERYAKAKDYLRVDAKTQGSPRKLVRAFQASATRNAKLAAMKSPRIKSPNANSPNKKSPSKKSPSIKSTKSKDGSPTQETKKSKDRKHKSDEKTSGVRRIQGDKSEEKTGDSRKTRSDKSDEKKEKKFKLNRQGDKSYENFSRSPSSQSGSEFESSPRKQINWNKQPKIAVKMNRTARMRLEKGFTTCGKHRKFKGDDYATRKAKQLAAAQAKEAERAEKARLRALALETALGTDAENAAGSGAAGAAEGGEDELDEETAKKIQNCEYMRCRRYAK